MAWIDLDEPAGEWVDLDTYVSPPKTEPEKRGVIGFAKDTAIDLAKGVVGFGESVAGIGSLVSFGAIGKGLEAIGYDPKQTSDFLSGFQSDARQQSEKAVAQETGFFGQLKALGTHPDVLIGKIVEALPGTIGTGAVAGTLVKSLAAKAAAEATATGLTGTAATDFIAGRVKDAAFKIAAVASGAEGAQTAGSIAEAGRQAGREWSDYVAPAIAAGLGTAAIGMVSGKIGQKLGIGDLETDVAVRAAGVKGAGAGTGGFLSRIGKEFIKEGALEEMTQSAQEQAFQNIATGRPIGEGVEQAAASGLIVGGAMGGGHAAIAGGSTPAAKPAAPDRTADILNAQDVDTAIAASQKALDEVAAPVEQTVDPLIGSQPEPVNDEQDFNDLLTSETRNLQVMDAQLAQDRQKQSELDAIPAIAADQNIVQSALQRAATLEAPTALEMAFQRARQEPAPAPQEPALPAAPAETAPVQPREVDRSFIEAFNAEAKQKGERQILPMSLAKAEQVAAKSPDAEVVRFPNIVRETGLPNGKFSYTVITKETDGTAGNVRPVDSGAIGGGSNQPSPSMATGMGDSGLAKPAVDAGSAADLPAGGVVSPVPAGDSGGVLGAVGATIRQRIEDAEPMSQAHSDAIDAYQTHLAQGAAQSIDSGEMPVFQSGTVTVTLGPSAQSPGMYQATRYNSTGAIGDSQYRSIDDAVSGEGLINSERLPAPAAAKRMADIVEAEAAYQAKKVASVTAQPAPASVQASDSVPVHFKSLLSSKSTKVILDDGKGRVLYDVKVTPEFRNKNFVNGRLPSVKGLELVRKEDVTKNPSDNGWVLIDNRAQIASREPAAAPAPAPQLPAAAKQSPKPKDAGHIGANNIPIAEGGKPFKTKKGADLARKMNPMLRAKQVQGGYVLAPKTEKQLAAEAIRVKRLSQPRTSPPGEPIPAHAFIASEGGLSKKHQNDLGVDGNQKIGNRWLFSALGRGMSIEQATEKLIQEQYLPEGASHTDAYNLIRKSLTQPQYNADGIERIAEAEQAARFDDYLTAQMEDAPEDPFGDLDDLDITVEDATVSGYYELSDPIKIEVNALLAQADALGIDTDTIKEKAYEATRNGSEQDYFESQRSQLQAAINQGNGGRSNQADPRADSEQGREAAISRSGEGGGADAGQQGGTAEPILTSPTKADIEAQQDRSDQAEKQSAAQRLAAEKQAAQDEDRKRIAKASEAAASTFTLGGDAMDNLTGQGSIFDAPDPSTPAKPAAEMSASELLRAAADKMDAEKAGPAQARRTNPTQTIEFKNPIVGPSGEKLVSYTWQWKPFEYVDKTGEERTGKLSDWDKSAGNVDTGREVVHQFTVENKDGETRIVSAESAIAALGYADKASDGSAKSAISAAKTLARNKMQLAELESALSAFMADQTDVNRMARPEVTRGDGGWWSMGDSKVRQTNQLFPNSKPDELLPERMRALEDGWRSNRLAERGWNLATENTLKEGIYDTKAQIKRAQAKLDAMTPDAAKPENQGAGKDAPAPAGDLRLSFAGQRAATADKFKLDSAQARIDAGESAETVRKETGWSRGADGKWRFEISDADAKLKGIQAVDDGIPIYESGTVGEYLDHPALFAAYPAIRNIDLIFQVMDGASVEGSFEAGTAGDAQYYGRSTEIKVQAPTLDRALSTLLHEIQHGIQNIEGFATGGSIESGRDMLADLQSREFSKAHGAWYESRTRWPTAYRTLMDQRMLDGKLYDKYGIKTMDDGGRPRKDMVLGAELRKKISEADKALRRAAQLAYGEAVESELGGFGSDAFNEFKGLHSAVIKAFEGSTETPASIYTRLAGEVEARNTQARQKLTDAQRAATPPSATADVADADVIVTFNGKDAQSAPMPANIGSPAPSTPIATIRESLTKAYGKLSSRLESKGLLSIHQTQDEAMQAAALARADARGTDVETELEGLRYGGTNQSMTNSNVVGNQGGRSADDNSPGAARQSLREVDLFGNGSRVQYFDDNRGLFYESQRYPSGKVGWKAGEVIDGQTQWLSDKDYPSMEDAIKSVRSQRAVNTRKANFQEKYGDIPNAWKGEAKKVAMAVIDAGHGVDRFSSSTQTNSKYLHLENGTKIRLADHDLPGAYDQADHEFRYGGDIADLVDRIQNESPAPTGDGALDIKRSADGRTQGFYDPITAKSFLIADNLTSDTAPGVLIHEIGIHAAADGTIDPLHQRAAELVAGDTSDFMREVANRMDAAGESSPEEAAAYIAEAYENNRLTAPKSVRQWIADYIAAIRGWLYKKGILIASSDLTPADIAAIARANARAVAEGGAQALEGELSLSSAGDQTLTAAFKRWFAGSKVVDSQGRPLVVYHGSPDLRFINEDGAFKSQKERAGFGRSEQAHWFTPSLATAKTYADERRAWDYQNAEGGTISAYIKLENPLIVDAGGANWRDAQKRGKTSDVIDEARANGHDGVVIRNVKDNYNNDAKTRPTDTYVVFSSTQIKSATGNNGQFDPTNPDIRRSRAAIGELKQQAQSVYNAAANTPGKLGWWHKTVGTQYNLAQRSPEFKRVYDAVQSFLNDVSFFATESADLAPTILPKLENWRDIAKSPLSAADTKAIAAPIFEGTLTWMRDESGKPVKVADMEEQAKALTSEQKAQRLLRNNKISANVLKMWKGMEADKYDAAVNSKYDSDMLKAGVVWTDQELTSLFNLNADQISLYREFRKATDKSLTDLALSDMLYVAGDDAAPIRDAVLASATPMEAAETIQKYLLSVAEYTPDRNDELLATADTMIDKSAKVQDLIDRGYAPLSRFGNYTLDVVDDTGERVYFGLFEGRFEAEQMAKKMREMHPGANVTQGTLSEQSYKLFSGVSPETVALFGGMMGLDGNPAYQEYIKLAKSSRSALKRLIERKGIAGFSEDAGRVLAGFVYSNARQTSQNLHAGEMSDAANAIPQQQGELKDHAVNLVEYIKNPQQEAQKIRGLLFAQYIGGSVASAMVNMTQPLTMTLPWLSQYGGITKAAKQMAAAVVDANKKTTGDAALDAALKRAEEDGTVSPQEVHDLMRQAQGKGALQSGDGSAAGDAYAKSSNMLSLVSFAWGKLFSAAEQFNRRSTFIAAYRTAVEQGLGDPSKFAEQAIAETQGIYNKGNKPEWARGSVGSILFTFKQYSVAYVEMLSRMATAGKPGSPERAAGQRSALYALGVLMLLSGAGGLPGADDLDDLISGLMQALGYNFDSKSKRKAFLVEHIGTGGADFVERGLSGLPGAPIDVSGRLGLGNLIPGTGLLTKKQDHTRDVLEFVGPAGDLFKRGFESAGNVVTGDIMGKNGAVATLAPKAMQNLFQAADMEQMGMYRDQTGKKVIDTDSGDALAKALGFQPGSVKRSQDASFEVQRMVGLNKINESRIVDKWAQGLFEKDPEKVQEARDELAQWNKNNPESPIRVKSQQIFSRVANMRMTKQQRIAKTAPAEIRREVFRELAQQ